MLWEITQHPHENSAWILQLYLTTGSGLMSRIYREKAHHPTTSRRYQIWNTFYDLVDLFFHESLKTLMNTLQFNSTNHDRSTYPWPGGTLYPTRHFPKFSVTLQNFEPRVSACCSSIQKNLTTRFQALWSWIVSYCVILNYTCGHWPLSSSHTHFGQYRRKKHLVKHLHHVKHLHLH